MRVLRKTFKQYCKDNLSLCQLKKLARNRPDLKKNLVQWYSFFYVLKDVNSGETFKITKENFDFNHKYPYLRYAPANAIIQGVCADIAADTKHKATLDDLLRVARVAAQAILREEKSTCALDKPRQKLLAKKQGGK